MGITGAVETPSNVMVIPQGYLYKTEVNNHYAPGIHAQYSFMRVGNTSYVCVMQKKHPVQPSGQADMAEQPLCKLRHE